MLNIMGSETLIDVRDKMKEVRKRASCKLTDDWTEQLIQIWVAYEKTGRNWRSISDITSAYNEATESNITKQNLAEKIPRLRCYLYLD